MTISDPVLSVLLSSAIDVLEGFAYGLFLGTGIVLRRTRTTAGRTFGYIFLAVTTLMFWLFPWWGKFYLFYGAILYWNRAPWTYATLIFLLIVSFAVGWWCARSVYMRAYRQAIQFTGEPAKAAF
jgi:hypothetical protein